MKTVNWIRLIRISTILLVLMLFISGCTYKLYDVDMGLQDHEILYLQKEDGSTLVKELNDEGKADFEEDYSLVGYYVETPIDTESVYWVPDYNLIEDFGGSLGNYTYTYEFTTTSGRPTKIPASVEIKQVIKDSNSDEYFVTLLVYDENGDRVDGNTHIFVNSPYNNSLKFLELDRPSSAPYYEEWRGGNATATVFGFPIDQEVFNYDDFRGKQPIKEQQEQGVAGFHVKSDNTEVLENGPIFIDVYNGPNTVASKVPVFLFDSWDDEVNLYVTFDILSNKAVLGWPEANGKEVGYRIQVDGEKIADVMPDDLESSDVDGITMYHYDISDLVPAQSYSFSVAPLYQDGEELFANAEISTEEVFLDTTKPVITLNGDSTLNVEVGSDYEEPGAKITDNSGEDLSEELHIDASAVNTDKVGSYKVHYSVEDSSGNEGKAERTVKVVDTTKPVITLAGDNPLVVEYGNIFVDPGVTAADNYDEDVTEEITVAGSVDENVVGEYTLTYTVEDSSGNEGKAERTVKVVDTTKPVVTLAGDNPLVVEYGNIFVDPGATAMDNYDGEVTEEITVAGSVDENVVGEYTLTYTVEDSSGNIGEVERTVKVVDTTKPVVTLVGDNPLVVEYGDTFVDPGVTATDNYDGDVTEEITVTGSVDENVVGEYTLTYTVEDRSGNVGEVERTVKIVDDNIVSLGEERKVRKGEGFIIEGTNSFISMPEDLPEGTTIKIEKVDGEPNGDLIVAGDVYRVTIVYPGEASPPQDGFILTLSYDNDADSDLVNIYYFDEEANEWILKGGQVNTENKTITLNVPHFSTYGVFQEVGSDEQVDDSDGNETPHTDVNDDGTVLPKTATPIFNWLLIGTIMLLIGSALVLWKKRNVER
ncbi:immunoglobulin-like domain-containing protein [Radiobacillus sp. PE A8.2]|uniref:immunoglobulin-like domain-containing protein n=1 Tax=Radiobacillus sp. PE A8.2 TaxID=3380349 RepID=UPI00388EDBC4